LVAQQPKRSKIGQMDSEEEEEEDEEEAAKMRKLHARARMQERVAEKNRKTEKKMRQELWMTFSEEKKTGIGNASLIGTPISEGHGKKR
jgi:hypothetical protein